ncbi:RTA1-like protein [Infundibulicybe gibba]|nr:RTA1-like protein [Infundibulicybe gibba]
MTFLADASSLASRHVGGSPYNYTPTEGVAITFIVLFSISTSNDHRWTVMHAMQSFSYRMWWMLPTACLCGVLEILGWSARLWSSFTPTAHEAFEIQICSTIMAPTPLVAANFVIIGLIIKSLGTAYSRLSPSWYTIVFCTFDIISLAVQGAGGAMASMAANHGGDPAIGGHVMLGGIAFQLATITIYVLCAVEFFIRYFKDAPLRTTLPYSPNEKSRGVIGKRMKVMIAALVFNTTCLFIRSVYRTIELSNGWDGRIISTQLYFNVLDGAMVVLAIYTLNFAHPGFLLAHPIRRTWVPSGLGGIMVVGFGAISNFL